MTRQRNQCFNTEHSDCILVVIGKLIVDRQNILYDMSNLELCAEFTKFGSASASNHRSVFLAEIHEFFAKLFLLTASSWIGVIK